MLYVEQNLSYENSMRVSADNIVKDLNKYSKDDILYTLEKLYEGNYLNGKKWHALGTPYPTFMLKDISMSGHELLAAIHDDVVWKQTKEKIKSFASVSLPIIQQVASSFLKQSLGL